MKIKELIIEECKDMQHEEERDIFIRNEEFDIDATVYALKETERDDSNGEYTSKMILRLLDMTLFFEDVKLKVYNIEFEWK